MKQTRYLRAITILAVSTLLIMIISTEAAPYSFSVDRFEIVGNLPVYFVDDFDDGVLEPAWFVYQPTVTEAGDVLTLSSPGDSSSGQLAGLLVASESTTANSSFPGPLSVQDGAGDFIGTSTWLNDLPGFGQHFFMEVSHELGPGVSESVSIMVSNPEPAIAAAFGLPTGGTVISFGRESFDVGDFDFQGVLINPMDVTGDILLRLVFEDASNQFSGAFSLDGGGTFQSPFAPVSPSAGDPTFRWGLHAMSFKPVPEPATILLMGTSLVGFAMLRRKFRK